MEQLHAYDCDQNVTEPRATENHTYVYTGTVSRAWLIYRLVQHRLQVVEMAWTDNNTLAIFFYLCYW